MTYEPQKKVIDHRYFVDNLFTYFRGEQTDALAWANDGEALPDIVKFYCSAAGRLTTQFPTLMLIRKDFAETGEDVLQGALSLTFECLITGFDGDTLAENAVRYDMAIRSMLTNAPAEELIDGAINLVDARLDSIESNFDTLRGSKTDATAFLQMFQIEATFMLIASYN